MKVQKPLSLIYRNVSFSSPLSLPLKSPLKFLLFTSKRNLVEKTQGMGFLHKTRTLKFSKLLQTTSPIWPQETLKIQKLFFLLISVILNLLSHWHWSCDSQTCTVWEFCRWLLSQLSKLLANKANFPQVKRSLSGLPCQSWFLSFFASGSFVFTTFPFQFSKHFPVEDLLMSLGIFFLSPFYLLPDRHSVCRILFTSSAQ